MKERRQSEKVDSPQEKIESPPAVPELGRRTVGGKVGGVKACGAGAASRGFNFDEKV